MNPGAQNERALALIAEKIIQDLKIKERDLQALETLIKEEQQRRKMLLEFSKLKNRKNFQIDGIYCTICNRSLFQGEEGFRLHYQMTHPNIPVPNLRSNLRKKIIVGNTSRYVPEKLREPDDNTTHHWVLYIRGPPEDTDLSYLRSVKIQIDPSYAPNDIIEMPNTENRPFFLKRRGWGEFPITVTFNFHNPDLNKPMEVVHMLKLDRTNCGREIIGPEMHIDIEFKLKPIELPVRSVPLILDMKSPNTPEPPLNGETPVRKRQRRDSGSLEKREPSVYCSVCGRIHDGLQEEACRYMHKDKIVHPSLNDLLQLKTYNYDHKIVLKEDTKTASSLQNEMSDEISIVRRAVAPFQIAYDPKSDALCEVILARAMNGFLKHMVDQSTVEMKSDTSDTFLASIHVLKAMMKNAEFIFLWNHDQ